MRKALLFVVGDGLRIKLVIEITRDEIGVDPVRT